MGEFSRIYKTDLTDRQMMNFWRDARLSNRDRELTMDVPPLSEKEFVEWMRRPDIHPWAVLFRGVTVGTFILEKLQGKTAHVHFITLPCGTHRTSHRGVSVVVGAGLFSLGSALWEPSETSFRLDTIIGITPAVNRRALHYAERLGGVRCGRIPGYCYYHDTHENVDGIVSIYNRIAVPEWTASL